jgi:DNA-directed RNA polymerase specialized sigma24 family protein
MMVEDVSGTRKRPICGCRRGAVQRAIAELPVEFREIVILREMEGFSYKEIADLSDVPIGTVMSRLARARKLLQKRLAGEFKPEVQNELPASQTAH